MLKNKIKALEDGILGVYILKNKDEVVYIGASINVKNRLQTHNGDKIKVFDSFEIEVSDEENLLFLEAQKIDQYRPIYNKRIPPIEKRAISAERNKTRSRIKSTSFTAKDVELINKVVDINDHKSFADLMYRATVELAQKEKKEIEKNKKTN